LRPADPEAHTSLATLYEWQGKFSESLREIEKLPPGEASGSTLLALRCADLVGMHRTREAEELAQRVARTPGFSEADVTAIFPVLESNKSAAVVATLVEALDAQQGASVASLR